jgi:prepilin-type N-terminal cleavage/methylation domain-containing protein
MRKNAGFNLIELMVALTVAAGVLALITSSFSQLYNTFIFNNKTLSMNQDIRLTMQLIKADVGNAGVFGGFSFRNQSSIITYRVVSVATPNCSNAAWCAFESNGVGVKSFTSDVDGVIPSDYPGLSSGSEILKIQYGGNKAAYLDPRDRNGVACDGSYNCTINKCSSSSSRYLNRTYFINTGIESNASVYMLTSANRAYLLQFANQNVFTTSDINLSAGELLLSFAGNLGCPSVGSVSVPIESYVAGVAPTYNYIAYDPDMFSLQLVNFYTRYYFVLSQNSTYAAGLYVRTLQSDGSLSTPTLISSNVNKLTITYLVDNSISLNKSVNDQALRFAYCSSTDMSNSGDTRCYNLWNKIVAVNISLTGSGSSSSMSNDQISESMTETVGWRS